MKPQTVYLYRRLAQLAQRYHKSFPLRWMDRSLLNSVIATNRSALLLIRDWVPNGLLENSVFRYGINPGVERVLNLPLDNGITHTDLLAYFGTKLRKPLRYLELGVSVGKTIWQILHTCSPCECWAFDIEEINPAIAARLSLLSRDEFPTPSPSIKTGPSSLSRFCHPSNGSKLNYLCADIFDAHAWQILALNKFNLILSDALHTPEALAFEWKQLTELQLLDPDEAVVIWDDLDGPMRGWFVGNRKFIAKTLGTPRSKVTTVYVNGWLGNKEYPHRLGLAVRTNYENV